MLYRDESSRAAGYLHGLFSQNFLLLFLLFFYSLSVVYQSSAGQIVSATTPGRRERPRSAHTTPLHFSLSLVVFHHVQKITLRVCYRLNTATIAEAHTRRASSSLHRRTTHVIRDVKQTTVAMAINNVTLPFVQPISPPAGIRLNSRKPQEED